MEVTQYHKELHVGSCKDENNKIYKIYKINVKKDYKYLVVGEKIKGKCMFSGSGQRIIIDIEPLDGQYECEKHPIYKYIQ